MKITAVHKKLDDSHDMYIYPFGYSNHEKIDVKKVKDLELYFSEENDSTVFFEYKRSEYNINPLRLKETKRYCCKVVSKNGPEKNCSPRYYPCVKGEGNKFLKIEKDDNFIVFQFVNYLGKSYISFGQNETLKIDFEVVPDKINYEEDYLGLTKAIADECSALLLDYTSPTSLSFLQVDEKETSLLEQFIFLKTFCDSDNLEGLFSSIKRNPDRILVTEDELKPFGQGLPSKKFFSSPFSNSRGWGKMQNGGFAPSEISVAHKYDSFDTIANRFVKFALNIFSEICQNIVEKVSLKRDGGDYLEEAKRISAIIDDILSDDFFDEVGQLQIMPVNNQVLEKREGYSQIFNAYSMIDLALKLDWSEQIDVYNGEVKNTALLYEYWLFFELRKILVELSGRECDVPEKEKTNRFISTNDGLTISLRQGKTSKQDFSFEKEGISVSLYYNKVFPKTDFSNSLYWGSYSNLFRPDYSIAVFPSIYKSEKDAIEAGDVSYVHFDAKYRVQDLRQLFSSENKKASPLDVLDNTEKDMTAEEKEELSDEKNDAVMNTYKQGDLLKMHTYNDAIRRTIGSYVLYPGDENKSNENASLYDELLPGVGAFAIRPGLKDAGHEEIKKFIRQIIDFRKNEATRNYRKSYFENMVIASPSEQYSVQPTGSDDLYMVGFFRKDYFEWLKVKHLIPTSETDSEFKTPKDGIYFYYHAIRDGHVYPLHKDVSKAKYFCARRKGDNVGETEVSKFNIDPWIAEIESTELVSVEDLVSQLKKMNNGDGFVSKREHRAEFYYLVKLKNIQPTNFLQDSFKELDSGNLAISAYSPKIAKRMK